MKLGAALAERAGHAREIEQLLGWAIDAARYQEGSEPAESADVLMSRAGDLIQKQARLIARINLTNATVRTADGESVTEALARRDALRALHKMRVSVVDQAAGHGRRGGLFRSMASELRDITNVDVPAVRREITGIAQQIRELDSAIQQAGLTADLIE